MNQADFQASAFDYPEKAIAALVESAPDLLISDVVMPNMTGVELAIHFRKAQPECKVLLFSGQAATADLLEKTRAEGYDFDLLDSIFVPWFELLCTAHLAGRPRLSDSRLVILLGLLRWWLSLGLADANSTGWP